MVSVIIPTHKREDFLLRAVKSVCNQTYKDIEIIVVSDGEFEETTLLMEHLMSEDSRIHYFSYSTSLGGNYARNYGIKKANGEYIAFLDDDDEWCHQKLEKQMLIFEQNTDVGLVYTGVNIVYVNEGVEYASIPDKEGDLSKVILLENCIGTTSTVVVKCQVLQEVGLFDENLPALQDYDLWIRVCQYTKVGNVREKLINYYNYRNLVQVSSSTQKYIQAYEVITAKYDVLIKRLSKGEQGQREINQGYLLVNKALRNNAPQEARYYLKKMIKRNIKYYAYYLMSFLDYKTILKIRRFI